MLLIVCGKWLALGGPAKGELTRGVADGKDSVFITAANVWGCPRGASFISPCAVFVSKHSRAVHFVKNWKRHLLNNINTYFGESKHFSWALSSFESLYALRRYIKKRSYTVYDSDYPEFSLVISNSTGFLITFIEKRLICKYAYLYIIRKPFYDSIADQNFATLIERFLFTLLCTFHPFQ